MEYGPDWTERPKSNDIEMFKFEVGKWEPTILAKIFGTK